MSLIQYETKAGDPVISGDTRITPFAQALHIQIPGLPGGLIWNRPVAVVVQTADGEEQVIPVPDVTRQAQISVWILALLGVFVFWLVSHRRK